MVNSLCKKSGSSCHRLHQPDCHLVSAVYVCGLVNGDGASHMSLSCRADQWRLTAQCTFHITELQASIQAANTQRIAAWFQTQAVFSPLHNVYMRDYDSPVYKIALYLLQGNNRISMYICRILALFPWNLVVATGEYLRENHEFRVWGSRKLKFTHKKNICWIK